MRFYRILSKDFNKAMSLMIPRIAIQVKMIPITGKIKLRLKDQRALIAFVI